jgi:tetratricopeptide (TPR) repeat protein
MTSKNQITSKEIHFLKSESDGCEITPPDHYLSDLIFSKTTQVESFEQRIKETEIPGNDFLCAVIEISSGPDEALIEKAAQMFEDMFNPLFEHKRGIWERLNETSFAIVFWDYAKEERAKDLIQSLKDKISQSLKADILAGVAKFPEHDFDKETTFHNALKAIDHAAFFGPNALVYFDEISLNISGDRLYQMKRFDKAILEYQKGLEINSKNANLLNSLGVCFGVTGELDKAKTEFDKAIAVSSNESMVIYNIGLFYNIDSDIDKAIVYLRKAHGIDPQIFEVELLLGNLLFKKDLIDQAIPHLEEASRLNEDSSLAYRIKGEIWLKKNDPTKAGKEFNRAIKINPSDAVSLSGCARSLELQNKNLAIALSFVRQSTKLDPDNKLYRERLGIIQSKLEDLKYAKEPTIKSA